MSFAPFLALANLLPLAVAADGKGSISGVVKDAGTGGPLKATVSLEDPPMSSVTMQSMSVEGRWKQTPSTLAEIQELIPRGVSASSAADGSYNLQGVAPGTHTITATVTDDNHGVVAKGSRTVTLDPGQSLKGVDIAVRMLATISGRVMDADRHPLPGVSVSLIRREYRAGVLEYLAAGGGRTDEDGLFELRAEPGRSYVLAVSPRRSGLEVAVSDDAERREAEMPRTYYPGTTHPEAAETLVLGPGESRQDIDIRVANAPAYCVEGVLEAAGIAPGRLSYTFEEEDASGVAVRTVDGGNASGDGKFRACHLFPGAYRVTAGLSILGLGATCAGLAPLNLPGADVRGVRVTAQPLPGISVRWEWDGPPPVPAEPRTLDVSFSRLQGGESFTLKAALDGQPDRHRPSPADFAVQIPNLPKGTYLKDLRIGGVSALRKPVLAWHAILAGAEIDVVVARDGGTIQGRVADKEGNPAMGLPVLILPADAATPAELAASMETEITDSRGQFVSKTLAPGRYLLLATGTPVYPTPECMARLWQARSDGQEVDVRPNGAPQVSLIPMTLR